MSKSGQPLQSNCSHSISNILVRKHHAQQEYEVSLKGLRSLQMKKSLLLLREFVGHGVRR